MPRLLAPTIWTRQPQQSVGIDWSNPITRQILFCVNGMDATATVGGALTGVTTGGYGTPFVSAPGVGRYLNTQAAKSVAAFGSVSGSQATALTYFIRTGTVGEYARLFDTRLGGSGFAIWMNDGGAGQNNIRVYCNADITNHSVSGTVSDSTKPTIVIVTVKDGSAEIYANGAMVASAAGGGNLVQTASNPYVLGSESASSIVSPFNGAIFLTVRWGRCLTQSEIRSLSANPWQIFAPLPRRNYIEVGSGATNHSLTPTELATPSPILGSPLVAQDHATTASALLTAAPVLGTPAVTQNHVVTASGIATAAPTLGSPAATQNHVVTASALATAAPTLGTPTLTDIPAGVIAVNGITTGAPVLGSPALTQNHVIAAGAIACGAPVFGPVTLAQQHAMLADGFATGSPVLGSSSLTSGVPSTGLSDEDVARIAAAVRAELSIELARVLDIAKINGLVPGVPAVVTQTSRIAGDVAQSISEVNGAVTVSRA